MWDLLTGILSRKADSSQISSEKTMIMSIGFLGQQKDYWFNLQNNNTAVFLKKQLHVGKILSPKKGRYRHLEKVFDFFLSDFV